MIGLTIETSDLKMEHEVQEPGQAKDFVCLVPTVSE